MTRLNYISKNLILIINKLISNENIIRLISIDEDNPLYKFSYHDFISEDGSEEDESKCYICDVKKKNHGDEKIDKASLPYSFSYHIFESKNGNKYCDKCGLEKTVDAHRYNDVLKNPSKLIGSRIYPYHFESYTGETRVEIRVYLPILYFKNGGFIEDTDIYFDILTHRDLYFIDSEDGSELTIRPHEIAQEIINMFNNNSVETVGKLDFTRLVQLNPDEKYQVTRLVASMFTIGT